MIYLDNNATTPVAPEVLEAMLPWFAEKPHNPSSPYPSGQAAADAIRRARSQVAALVGVQPAQITFTSGGSESITSAFATAFQDTCRTRAIVSAVEHSAVKKCAERYGRDVISVPVDADGRLDRAFLFDAIDGDTALVSLMLVNNETGVVTDLDGVSAACRSAGVSFHVDAIQGPGKLPVDLPATGADFASLSSHKLHGPKGVGALYVQGDTPFLPLVLGGGQENERRAGTENVPGMIGFGAAAELAKNHVEDASDLERVAALRNQLEQGLLERVPGASVHGADCDRVGNTSLVHLPIGEARATLLMLAEFGVEVSAGSACTAKTAGPSPVLLAMGRSEEEASQSLRFSLSRYTTAEDIERALVAFDGALETLRALG